MAAKIKAETEDKKVKVEYIGDNPSYTVAGVRFSVKNKAALLDGEVAKALISRGKFKEIDASIKT